MKPTAVRPSGVLRSRIGGTDCVWAFSDRPFGVGLGAGMILLTGVGPGVGALVSVWSLVVVPRELRSGLAGL